MRRQLHKLPSPKKQFWYDGVTSEFFKSKTYNPTMMSNSCSLIADFFASKSVFLTGVTGFVGKAVLEKLLRACPGVLRVYVLIREKEGETAEQRLSAVFQNPLFARLRVKNPEAFKKVKAIQGDITTEGLGLSQSDYRKLLGEISVVIHSAASTKFNQTLKNLVRTNATGTINMVNMALNMELLQAFVYISTAYSNCSKREEKVPETVSTTTVAPQTVVDAIAGMTESQAAAYVQSLMDGCLNYYTFSKSLAEQVVNSYKGTLRMCIVRPSIVSATLSEPVSGWVDSRDKVTHSFVAILQGYLRCLPVSHKHATVDLAPVDLVSNLILAAAWYTASVHEKSRRTVFHCCSKGSNPLTFKTLLSTSRKAVHYYSFENTIWYPSMVRVPWKLVYPVADFVLHRVPCQLLDTGMKLMGKNPRFMGAYSRIADMTSLLDSLINTDFQFSLRNTRYLYDRLTGTDRQLFNFSPDSVRWSYYIHNYVEGMRRFVLFDGKDDIMVARARLNRLYYLHHGLKYLLFLVPLPLLIWITVHQGLHFVTQQQNSNATKTML